MPEHSWDLPLAALIAVLVIKEGAALVKYLIARLNGTKDCDRSQSVTRADLSEAKAELIDAMRMGQDQLHARITDVSERLARLEGRM